MYFLIFYLYFLCGSFLFGLVRDDWSPCVAIGRLSAARDIARMGEAWKFVRLRRWWCRRFYSFFLFYFPLLWLLCVFLSSSSSSSLGLVTRSVSARSRSLSFVYCHWRWQDDGVHVKCSSDSACDRRGFSGAKLRALLRSTFPRHSSTPARLYSTLLSLYFFLFQRSRSTPYITQPSNTTTTLFSLYTLFFFFIPIFILFFLFDYFYFLFWPPSPVTLRYTASALDTCQTLRCPRVHFLMRTLYLFTRNDGDQRQLDLLVSPSLSCYFLFFFLFLFFFIFDRVCVRSHFFPFYIYRRNRSCPTGHW